MTAFASVTSPGPLDQARRMAPAWIVCAIAIGCALPACRRETAPPHAPTGATRIAIGIPSADAPISPLEFLLTQARLVRLDQGGHARPGVLDRWMRSPDGRTWTLWVRAGVRLHEGRSATAADVAELLREAVADADMQPGLWPVTAIDVTGPLELRVTLSEPTSLLLDALSVLTTPAGPYRVSSATSPTPDFLAVGGQAEYPGQIATVNVRRYETPRAAVTALLRRDIDVLYELPADAQTLLATEGDVRTYPHLKPYVVTLGLNHRHPALKHRDVRLALNALVDREAIVAQDAGGSGTPAADILWRDHWTRPHVADAEAMRVDRPRARRLLDRAGFPARRRADGGSSPRLRLTCLVLQEPTMARVAGRLQQTFAASDIQLDLVPLALPALLQRLGRGDFDAFVSPVVSGFGLALPYAYFARHDRPRPVDDGYTAAAAAAEAVRRASTDEEFARAVHELHGVLLNDPPAVSLYWQQTHRAVGPRVTVPEIEGDVLAALPRWTVAREAP